MGKMQGEEEGEGGLKEKGVQGREGDRKERKEMCGVEKEKGR